MKSMFAVLLLVLLESLTCAMPTVAQDSVEVASITSESLPDAPSTIEATTCTKNNGKPCSKFALRAVGQYPPVSDSEIPDHRNSPASFWTYRGGQDPPLRTSKEVFRSKIFILTHVGEAVAAIVVCRNKKSGQDCGQTIPLSGGLVALDYLEFRFIGGPNAIGPPIALMIYYSHESTR